MVSLEEAIDRVWQGCVCASIKERERRRRAVRPDDSRAISDACIAVASTSISSRHVGPGCS